MVLKWMTAGVALALSVFPAYGALATTAAGTAAGFGAVVSVISGWTETHTDSKGPVGPLGMVITPVGTLLVTDAVGHVYSFANDANGQVFPGVGAATATYTLDNAVALVNLAGTLYMTQNVAEALHKVSNTGTDLGAVTITPAIAQHLNGMIVDPFTNHLIISGDGRGIYDVNPVTGTHTTIDAATASYDGLALSADGTTLYAADASNNRVVSINLSTLALTSLGAITNPDGIAVGAGAHAGNIYVNTNGTAAPTPGQFIQISLAAGNAQTVIATGGSRGDFVYVDPCGKILITQSDGIVSFGNGCGLFSSVPEPGTLPLLGIGVVLVGLARRRRAH